jgi:hypothetical protein
VAAAAPMALAAVEADTLSEPILPWLLALLRHALLAQQALVALYSLTGRVAATQASVLFAVRKVAVAVSHSLAVVELAALRRQELVTSAIPVAVARKAAAAAAAAAVRRGQVAMVAMRRLRQVVQLTTAQLRVALSLVEEDILARNLAAHMDAEAAAVRRAHLQVAAVSVAHMVVAAVAAITAAARTQVVMVVAA